MDIGERIGTSREEGQLWLWSALLLGGWFQSCSFNLKSYPRSKVAMVYEFCKQDAGVEVYGSSSFHFYKIN